MPGGTRETGGDVYKRQALDLSHKTADNIRGRQVFTVSITDAAHIPQADYVGSVSGLSLIHIYSSG